MRRMTSSDLSQLSNFSDKCSAGSPELRLLDHVTERDAKGSILLFMSSPGVSGLLRKKLRSANLDLLPLLNHDLRS